MIQPTSYQNPLTNSHGYYHILGRRDGGGGYGALLQSYNGNEIFHGNTTQNTNNINWHKIWTDANFTQAEINNWGTAHSWGDHSLAGYTGDQDLSGYATETYVGTQIDNLINSAPGLLNTLDELAAALGDDPSFATTITTSIATKLPLSGGTLTGNLHLTDPSTAGTSGKVQFGTNTSWNNNIGLESYWMKFGCNQNEGFKFADSTGNMILQLNGANSSSGNGQLSATFVGVISASGGNSSNWNTSYGWGDHASGGYLSDDTNYLKSNTSDSFSGILTGTAAGENLKVGGIRGTDKGSQTGEYIHLYNRVHIGGPNGWGASSHGAPNHGLSTWGSANFGMNSTGVLQLNGTTFLTKDRLLQNVTNTNWDTTTNTTIFKCNVFTT